jgi:glycosyltransferase involved in cell wall biosynthesis
MRASVSIVIPAYRARDFLHRAVASVRAQTRCDWELLIVADDDLDYERALRERGLTGDARIRFASTGCHGGGAGTARNVGIDASRADIVVLLDADDALRADALDRLVPLAHAHGVAYSDVRFVLDRSGLPLPNLDRPLPAGLVSLEDVLTSRVHTHAFLAYDKTRVRARCLEGRVGWEDACFVAQCLDEVGGRAYHLDEPLYEYRRRDGATTNGTESAVAEYFLRSADRLLDALAAGDSFGIRDPLLRDVLARYLRGRQRLESMFLHGHAAGGWSDFLAFAAARRDLFHRLDVEPEQRPGEGGNRPARRSPVNGLTAARSSGQARERRAGSAAP